MADLWSVLLGGVIGVGGSGLTQWLLHREKWHAERKKTLSEKFEDMIEALYDHEAWLDEFRGQAVFGFDKVRASPISRAQTISLVHFPDTDEIFKKYDQGRATYMYWMLAAGQKRMKGEKDYSNDYSAAWAKYKNCRDELFNELRKYGQTKFHQEKKLNDWLGTGAQTRTGTSP